MLKYASIRVYGDDAAQKSYYASPRTVFVSMVAVLRRLFMLFLVSFLVLARFGVRLASDSMLTDALVEII